MIILASVFGWSGAIAGDDFVPGRVFHCDGFDVSVHSADPADAKIACEGARAAIDFLFAQGLDVVDEVLIDIVPELPPVAGSSASGCYLESEKRVFVLPYSEFEKLETWFNLPIDASLYRSLVSHEVAHALGACNFRIDTPSISNSRSEPDSGYFFTSRGSTNQASTPRRSVDGRRSSRLFSGTAGLRVAHSGELALARGLTARRTVRL